MRLVLPHLLLLLLPLTQATLIPHWERIMISYQHAARNAALSAASHPGPNPDLEGDYSTSSSSDPDLLGTTTSNSIPSKFAPADRRKSTREEHELALQVWEGGAGDVGGGMALREVMEESLRLVRGMVEFVVRMRWREQEVVEALVPVVQIWIVMCGFETGWVKDGSLAARIHKTITPLPKSSLTTFISHHGGTSFARRATKMGSSWLVAALQISAVGKLLHDEGAGLAEAEVERFANRVWDLVYKEESPRAGKLGVFWERCVRVWGKLPNGDVHKEL